MSGFFYMIKKQSIIDILKHIKYPGFSRDIVSFGIIKNIEINNEGIIISLNVKSNNQKLIKQLEDSIKKNIGDNFDVKSIKVIVELQKGERELKKQEKVY